MKYNRLGMTDIMVSEFALGCWPFEGGETWGYQSDDDSIAAVHAALDGGVNFFDTAESYGAGHSESVLGKGLAGRRADAVIATKVNEVHLHPDEVAPACEGSLERLGTDYIDLYLIHWPNHDIPLAETVGAVSRLMEQGKVRAIGVCNFGVRDLTDVLELERIEVDQLPYNLLWRPIEDEILPLCRKNGIGLMVYCPLAQGLLTGRYANADEVPNGVARSRLFSGERPMAMHDGPGMEDEMFEAIATIRKISDDAAQPPAAVSLAWLRREEAVTALLVGARSAAEVRMNLPAFELDLPDDAAAALSAATDGIKAELHGNPDMWKQPGRMR